MRRRSIAARVALLVTLAGCGASSAPAVQPLSGTLRLNGGVCSSATGRPTGSYLVVISAVTGKIVPNRAGGCANPDYTPLTPGTDGGLILGQFQGEPAPTFDAGRNSLASRIIQPVIFDGLRLGLATSARYEQSGNSPDAAFPVPRAQLVKGVLNVDLRSLVFSYGGRGNSTCAETLGRGCYELGSFKAAGIYDPVSRHFVLDWVSSGAFTAKGDSMETHLEGTLVP